MINVNLVGNPNTGKTTLYNNLTSSNEHVGNWHGVTVEEKAKIYKFKNEEIRLVDLPGIYSLTPLSFEEEVSTSHILKNRDVCVVNICDANNLERNLYLTLGLMELGCPIILAVNQIGKRMNCQVNYSKLEQILGIKVVVIDASKKESTKMLNQAILEMEKEGKTYNLPYTKELVKDFKKDASLYQKIKCLEDDDKVKNELGIKENFDKMEEVAQARYEYIESIMAACSSKKTRVYGMSKFDKVLLNRFFAIPIFLLFMGVAFYLTFFSVGKWLSDLLRMGLDFCVGNPIISLFSNTFGAQSWLTGMIESAVVGGLGSLLSFLPQVALLFFFLSILEDSGYLSRVAFVTDDLLSKVGLSGKSVYTLLMGFGCSTTAILTARTMEDKNSKIKTSLLSPYMSCSAKFPIYAVIGGAFFGTKNIFVIMGLYLLGIVIAVAISMLLEKSVLKSKEQSFILEFPPYRLMNGKRITKLLWQNVKMFVVRVGSLILAMNIIVWILSNFNFTFKFVGANGGGMLETLGRVFAPIFAPLGFNNWAIVAALIAGLIAKEVVVSSIAMFNHCPLSIDTIQQSLFASSSVVFFASKSSVISFLVFCLLYSPCLASISVLSKEIGKKWAAVGVVIQFIVAYLTSFIVFNLSNLLARVGLTKFFLFVLSIFAIIVAVVFLCKKIKNKNFCSNCDKCSQNCKKR